ncbi:MAG: SDR family NAD(P)-dependent oxidoreductase [Agarilytica sp.]
MSVEGGDVAIVGLSVRLPKAKDHWALWRLMENSGYGIGEIPSDRWNVEKYFSDHREPNKYYCKWGGFLSGINEFDPRLFKISPKEAASMDPQQRLVLMNVWNLLEDAGKTIDGMSRNTGVYFAVNSHDYAVFDNQAFTDHKISARNSDHYQVANRVSYHFNFKGPSVALDNACAGSGTALHMACQGLKSGDCDAAVVGGVNLILHPSRMLHFCSLEFVAPNSNILPFDERASGTLFSEGVCSVLLKPLKEAEAQGDHIYGVIAGSAINSGGHVKGFTVPNPKQQSSVIASAIQRAGVDARDIGYVEAHGTGTPVGDPIEVLGLNRAFEANTDNNETQYCALGTIKSNIGHCEPAAALAGLAKILLQLKHRKITPIVNIEQVNSRLKLSSSPFKLPTSLEEWPEYNNARVAGLSSFGAGGSNAHVIVKQHGCDADTLNKTRASSHRPYLIPISATNPLQLKHYLSRLYEVLNEDKDIVSLCDIAHTLALGRETLSHRAWVYAESIEDLISILEEFINHNGSPCLAEDGPDNPYENLLAGLDDGLKTAASRWMISGEKSERFNAYFLEGKIIPLPGAPFKELKEYGLENYLSFEKKSVKHERFVCKELIASDSVLFTHHVVQQREVLPGVALMCFSRRHLKEKFPSRVWRFSVVWEQPVESSYEDSHLDFAYEWSGGKYHVSVVDQLSSIRVATLVAVHEEKEITASGQKLSLAGNEALASSEEVYAKFSRMGIDYGPEFRLISNVVFSGSTVVGEYYTQKKSLRDISIVDEVARIDSAAQAYLPLLDETKYSRALIPTRINSAVFLPDFSHFDRVVVLVEPGAGRDLVCTIELMCEGRLVGALSGLVLHHVELNVSRNSRLMSLISSPVKKAPIFEPKQKVIWTSNTIQQSGNENWTSWLASSLLHELEKFDPGTPIRINTINDYCAFDAASLPEALIHDAMTLRGFYEGFMKSGFTAHVDIHAYPIGVGMDINGMVVPAHQGLFKSIQRELSHIPINIYAHEAVGNVNDSLNILREHIIFDVVEKTQHNLALSVEPFVDSSDTVKFSDGDIAVIAGGAGKLGQFSCEYLLSVGISKVYLLGRSLPSSSLIKFIDDFNALDERVAFVQVDLLDKGALLKSMSKIHERHGNIRLAVHSAGTILDGGFLSTDENSYKTVIRSKYETLINLHQVLDQYRCDQLVAYSSVAPLIGSAGQSNYCVANALVDGFCRYHSGSKNGMSVKSIAWPLWKEGGMGSSLFIKKRVNKQYGIDPLPTLLGKKVLNSVLARNMASTSVVYGISDVLNEKLGQSLHGEPLAKEDGGGVDQKDQDTASLISAESVELLIKLSIASVLELEPDEIGLDDSFDDLGFDSISLIDLSVDLGSKIGGKIPDGWEVEEWTIGEFIDKYCEYAVEKGLTGEAAEASSEEEGSLSDSRGVTSLAATPHMGVYASGKVSMPYHYHHVSDELPLLLIFPGIMMRSGSWAFLYEDENIFSRCNILMFEHEGQFNANKLDHADDEFSLDENCSHIREILKLLELDNQKHHVMGISSGCVLQTAYVNTYSDDVLSSLMFAPLFITGRRIQLNVESIANLGDVIDDDMLEKFLNMFYFDYFSDQFLDNREKTVSFMRSNVQKLSQEHKTMARSLSSLMKTYSKFGYDFDEWAKVYSDTNVETRMVICSDDRLVTPEHLVTCADKMGSAVHVVEGVGHVLFLEREEHFKEIVVNWLTGEYGKNKRKYDIERTLVNLPCSIEVNGEEVSASTHIRDISGNASGFALHVLQQWEDGINGPITVKLNVFGGVRYICEVRWTQEDLTGTLFGLKVLETIDDTRLTNELAG